MLFTEFQFITIISCPDLLLYYRVCHHSLTDTYKSEGRALKLGKLPSLTKRFISMLTHLSFGLADLRRFQWGICHSPRCMSRVHILGSYCWTVRVKVRTGIFFGPGHHANLHLFSWNDALIPSQCVKAEADSVPFGVDRYSFGSKEPMRYGTWLSIFRWCSNYTDNRGVAKS